MSPPSVVVVHHTRKLAITSLLAVGPACFIEITPLDDEGATTGNDPACSFGTQCNGVFIYCQNNNVGGGADDTGGDGGAAPNFWWVHYDQQAPDPVPFCGDSIPEDFGNGNDICCVEGCDRMQPDNNCCYIKQVDEPGNGVSPLGKTVRHCLGEGTPIANVHPVGETDGEGVWVSGSYPDKEDEIRALCSARCSDELHSQVEELDANPVCDEDKWSDIQTRPSWHPDQGYNCLVGAALNVVDPDGSEIPWHLVGGPTVPQVLDCDLNADCVDWFYPTVAPFVLSPESATFIEPETRTAHYVGVESGDSRVALDLDMAGSTRGVDDEEPLFGIAEYTALDCSDPVCPFYLANLSAYNTTDDWNVRLDAGVNRPIKKLVGDVQIDLMQSTLGVRHMGLDKIAFAPGALRLRVQVEITASPGSSTYGDGTRSAIVENIDYVFADYDDGALQLAHSFPVQSGQGTLVMNVVPDEHPPVAEHDLGTTELCNAGTGHLLDASHILSSDPDDDIVVDVWWIDGQLCSGECVVPLGSHQVALEARDARGAVHRTAAQWVYVTPPCT